MKILVYITCHFLGYIPFFLVLIWWSWIFLKEDPLVVILLTSPHLWGKISFCSYYFLFLLTFFSSTFSFVISVSFSSVWVMVWRWRRALTQGIRWRWISPKWCFFPFSFCLAFFSLGREIVITTRVLILSSFPYIFIIRKIGFIMTTWWWDIFISLLFLHYHEKF